MRPPTIGTRRLRRRLALLRESADRAYVTGFPSGGRRPVVAPAYPTPSSPADRRPARCARARGRAERRRRQTSASGVRPLYAASRVSASASAGAATSSAKARPRAPGTTFAASPPTYATSSSLTVIGAPVAWA